MSDRRIQNPGSRARLGFSLAELLVVIVIIAVLVSLIMGALNLLVKQERRVATLSLMDQIQTALQEYLATYPTLGANANSQDFIDSPWTFLGRNPIVASQQPYLGHLPNKFLAVGPAVGPWTAGTQLNGDQILDAYPAADRSNHFIWYIVNNVNASGRNYVDRVYLRSSAGTPLDPNDDLIHCLYIATGQWQTLTYAQSLTDIPIASW